MLVASKPNMVLKGVNILRVHDVKEAKEIIKMINLVEENN